MRISFLLRILLLAGAGCLAGAAEMSLTSVRDNTLYAPNSEDHSNGGGATFGAGSNGLSEPRRGLVLFDLSAIPPGATIESATLRLTLARAGATDVDRLIALHRALASWGENPASDAGSGSNAGFGVPAQPGDATWRTRFFGPGPDWTAPGGDFVASPSASVSVSTQLVPFLWSGPGVLADVRAWQAAPGSNFGWLLRGDETIDRTNRQFHTRETATAGAAPTLLVTFAERMIITIEREAGGSFRIHGAGAPERTYTVEFTASLAAPHWQPLGTRAADAEGRYSIVDTPPPGVAARFYRAVFP